MDVSFYPSSETVVETQEHRDFQTVTITDPSSKLVLFVVPGRLEFARQLAQQLLLAAGAVEGQQHAQTAVAA